MLSSYKRCFIWKTDQYNELHELRQYYNILVEPHLKLFSQEQKSDGLISNSTAAPAGPASFKAF